MTVSRAFAYFFSEAFLNLARSWKVSAVAVITIAVSLFVGGLFQLVGGNLSAQLERWRRETKAIIYLQPDTPAGDVERLAAQLEQAARPWLTSIDIIDPETARERFRELFPSLSGLVEGWDDEPLPGSIEVGFNADRLDPQQLDLWLAEARARPEVAMVDDDRDWLGQLETALLIVRTGGLILGMILLAAAIFTIASVVRLTAYLYQEEIDIMRLVGATEFFIRGPFYAEGLLQGLFGSLLGTLLLLVTHRLAVARWAETSNWVGILTRGFLSWPQISFLLLLGTAAGLLGAILSLRKEKLGNTEP
jgi:cell division transport system permease protein